MTSMSIYQKNFMLNWRKQLWVLVFMAGLSCLGQTVQPPLGATPKQSGTTFRLWAPFVDSVVVKVNDREPVRMSKEDGHPQADDTMWVAEVPGAKVGDHYKYLITSSGVTREFIDPRARQLTSPEVGGASLIVDPSVTSSQSVEPLFSQMVLYELHIGTFNVLPGQATGTFQSAIEKLDFLKQLGVNVVEVMPVHENVRSNSHAPVNFNWGYDPVQLFAVNSSYGTAQDLKRFVKACHDRSIL
jgi:1,4-alpha-glucan branching enzyme